MATLRELLLSVKVRVDKDAVKETDVAFDQATKSAERFESRVNAAVSAVTKLRAKLAENAKLSDALGVRAGSHPTPPRPKGANSMAAPDVEQFFDRRTGPQKALDALKEKAGAAMASAGQFVDRFNAKFDGTVKAIFNARTAMTGLAVVVAGTAIGRFIDDVIEAGGQLHDMAQRTRVSVETLQVWRAIATDAGVDAGAIEGAFRKLTKSMAAAARGSKLQAASFKELGVSVKNTDGSLRPVDEVLIDTGAALAAMDDDAKATAIAVQLLGPAGAGLVPAFNNGADAVRKLSAEMKENVALNAEEAARLDDVGDALTRGQKKWTALKTRAIVAILPALQAASGAFEKVSKWILRMAKETSTLQTILAALTGVGLFRLVTMLGAWIVKAGGARAALALFGQGLQTAAGFALRFIAPLLIIEDFLTFLAGGKSLFGRAFEEIFGAGGAKEKRQELLDFFTQIGTAASSVATAAGAIVGSPLFVGAAKTALEAILAVLNLIGLALADNTEKADKLAGSLQGHLSKIGLAPTREHVEQLNKDALPEDLGGKKRAPVQPDGFFGGLARKAMVTVLGDPTQQPGFKAAQAKIEAMRAAKAENGGGMAGVPAAAKPPVTINDQRKIEVNVGPSATPGETARGVAGAVGDVLTKDRRQTLSAVSG